MKYRHLSILSLLLLSTLPDTFGFDPKAISLQRRKPQPMISKPFTCCMKPTDTVAGPDSLNAYPTQLKEPAFRENDFRYDEPAKSLFNKPRPALKKWKQNAYPTRLAEPAYTVEGFRYVVGVVLLDQNRGKILLIKDRKAEGKWRFPEGDRSKKELAEETVVREALDTAGIQVRIDDSIHSPKHVDDAPPKTEEKEPSKSHYYQASLRSPEDELKEWPKSKRWERKWASYDEAVSLLEDADQKQMMMLSDIRRPELGRKNPRITANRWGPFHTPFTDNWPYLQGTRYPKSQDQV